MTSLSKRLQNWNRLRRQELLRILPYACILAAFSVLSLHIDLVDSNESLDGQTIWGHFWENHLTDFTFADPIILFALVIVWGFAIYFLTLLLDWKRLRLRGDAPKAHGYLWFLIPCLMMIICWLPYVLSWFPGGVYSDTYIVITQAELGQWSNRHTFFYTLLWRLCIDLSSIFGKGTIAAVVFMTILQVLLFAVALALSVYWLRKRGINRVWCGITVAFYCLFPAFPLSAISLWKDSVFSIFLFLYIFIYICIYLAKQISLFEGATFCTLSLLVAFSRNNGIYIILGSILILAFLRKRTALKSDRSFFLGAFLTAVFALLIQGPIYAVIGASAPLEENLGVPLQQLASVICADGNLSDGQLAYLDAIMPLNEWRELYRPCLVDAIKWSTAFDISSIAQDPLEFWTTYFMIGLKNPIIYAKAFFLNNCGFWDPFVGTNENIACYQYVMWSWVDFPQWDVVEKVLGFSLRPLLEPMVFPSSGLYAWFMFISMALLGNARCRLRDGLLLTPLLLLWLTLMFATPIAYSVRYFFSAILLVPAFIFLPVILHPQHNDATVQASK